MEKQVLKHPIFIEGFENVRSKMNSCIIDQNKEKFYNLLFTNPEYILSSSFQMYDKEITLYPEQREMILDIGQALRSNKPLLYSNQHSVGMGKTFCAAPLCNYLNREFHSKTLLFTCCNELVRSQVAADILCGDSLHLWLAKSTTVQNKEGKRVPRYLIRPYKSCFNSTNWKTVYRDQQSNEMKYGDLCSQWIYYRKKPGKILTSS